MEKIFMMLLEWAVETGELEKVHYFDTNYASIDFTKDKKKYSLSVSCEDVKEEEIDGN